MELINTSAAYLLRRLLARILDFFRHWYVDGFLKASDWSLRALERLDRIFAIRITLKNWLQPLYQDYSLIGYLWGFIFRSMRIFAGLSVYLSFLLLSVCIFLLWALLPIYAIYQIFANF